MHAISVLTYIHNGILKYEHIRSNTVNGKMLPVETTPGRGRGRWKGKFKYDIFDTL
jgi:hypothetical protein